MQQRNGRPKFHSDREGGGVHSGLAGQDLMPMSLGLSHSLSRYKLKFSPDKVCPAHAELRMYIREGVEVLEAVGVPG